MEEQKPTRFAIQPRILILFLILGIPPLILGHFLLVNRAENRFRDVVGTYFGQRAERLQDDLANYIDGLSVRVANLARVPAVDAVTRQAYRNPPDEKRFAEQVQQIDAEWPAMTTENSKLLAGILENPASQFLHDYNRVATVFREILISDRYGRLIAASGKASDYFQADETWWRVAYLEGRGQRHISGIEYDESVGAYSLTLAEAIRDDSTQQVLGIVKAVVDNHEMFGILDEVGLGSESAAVLFRPDGTMVTSFESGDTYPFIEAVRAGMSRGVRYLEVPEQNPGFFLGLPGSSFKERIPELDWLLVVESPREKVFAPFSNLRSWFLYFAVFSVGLVILLAILFSWILSRPIIETDPHLETI